MTAAEAARIMMSGGTSQSAIFHYILDNSEAWIYATIDANFKLSASLLDTGAFELYNSGEMQWNAGTDSDGTKFADVVYRKNRYCFMTAWEDDKPLYSVILGSWTYSDAWDTFRYTGSDSIERRYWYTQYERNVKPGSFSFNGNLSINLSSTPITVSVPGFSYVQTEQAYRVDSSDPGSFPKVVPYGNPRETTYTTTYGISNRIGPYYYGTFSDMPYTGVTGKCREIIRAIYEVNGYDFRNAYVPATE